MSPPGGLTPVIITADDILTYDEDQLVRFLNDCRVGEGFDISRVDGVDRLSADKREEFAVKVR